MQQSDHPGQERHAYTLPSGWVTRVATAEDMEALSTVSAELALEIGFSRVTYSLHDMTTRTPGSRAEPLVWFSRYPADWIARYTAKEYARNDPVVRAAAHGRPFRWNDLDDASMTPAQRSILAEARVFGIHDGFCVPAHTSDMLGLFNALADGSEAERRAALEHGTESLTALGLVVHERARHLLLRASGTVFTDLHPDTLKALELIAAGADAPEAAAAMRMSEAELQQMLDTLLHQLKLPPISGLRIRAVLLGLAGQGRPWTG